MADKTTITVTRETLERFKQLKSTADEELDALDYSNDGFLGLVLDAYEDGNSDVITNSNTDGIDTNELAREVAEALAGRLDDLETNIERKIELEVRGQ